MKNNQELKIIIQDYYGFKIKRYINLVTHDLDSLSSEDILSHLEPLSKEDYDYYENL